MEDPCGSSAAAAQKLAAAALTVRPLPFASDAADTAFAADWPLRAVGRSALPAESPLPWDGMPASAAPADAPVSGLRPPPALWAARLLPAAANGLTMPAACVGARELSPEVAEAPAAGRARPARARVRASAADTSGTLLLGLPAADGLAGRTGSCRMLLPLRVVCPKLASRWPGSRSLAWSALRCTVASEPPCMCALGSGALHLLSANPASACCMPPLLPKGLRQVLGTA